jgi:short-subunit dehydrogenase
MNTQANKGKALITGGSAGIGAIYADRLAKRGYDLVLVARDEAKLKQTAARLTAETGRTVEIIKADLSAPADLRLVEQKLANDNAITMLVNNAGLGGTKGLTDSTPEELDQLIAVNVTALTRLSRAVAPAFVARGTGTIINMSSVVAVLPGVLNGTSSAAKQYVLTLSLSLNDELSKKGVRVQVVLPGLTRTGFWDHAGMPVSNLPQDRVMSADDLVDAALSGLDQGELVTIPSMQTLDTWNAYVAAGSAMRPFLSHSKPADRYKQTT